MPGVYRCPCLAGWPAYYYSKYHSRVQVSGPSAGADAGEGAEYQWGRCRFLGQVSGTKVHSIPYTFKPVKFNPRQQAMRDIHQCL